MNKYPDFLFQFFLPYAAVMFCGITIPYMGFVEAESFMEYLDAIPKEHFHEFLMILVYFALSFLNPLIIISLCSCLIYAIYRLSLSRIYRKPRRVYPVEKQKFFSLY